MKNPAQFSDQVRLALSAAGAEWAAALVRDPGAYRVAAVWGMVDPEKVTGLVAGLQATRWLDGAARTGRLRTRRVASESAAAPPLRLSVFTGKGASRALLVASRGGVQDRASRSLLRLLSSELAGLPAEALAGVPETPDEGARQEFLRVAEQIGGLDITELDFESVLRRSVQRSRELVGGAGAELGLVDSGSGSVRILWSDVPGREDRQYTVRLGEQAIGRIAESGEPLLNAGTSNGHNLGAVIGVPLKYKGAVIGALAVVGEDPARPFSGEDLRLLELLASQVAVSIRNARLFHELGERIKSQREAEKKMVEAARLAAIGEMAASIAHELNNPLTTISGFSELLMDDFPEGSPQRENMGLVLQEARRAREVVRRLLDFSRREKSLKGPVNLTEAVSEVVALVQPMAQIQQVEIRFEAWEDLPEIYGDRSQLRQVLLNLVTNGIQAMPQGGKLSILTAVGPPEEERIAIRIQDTGVGIPPAYLPQVFDPFFTTKPVGSGTGLGLSISQNIIADHGGEIRVESEEGQGTCFTVLLPVNEAGVGQR